MKVLFFINAAIALAPSFTAFTLAKDEVKRSVGFHFKNPSDPTSCNSNPTTNLCQDNLIFNKYDRFSGIHEMYLDDILRDPHNSNLHDRLDYSMLQFNKQNVWDTRFWRAADNSMELSSYQSEGSMAWFKACGKLVENELKNLIDSSNHTRANPDKSTNVVSYMVMSGLENTPIDDFGILYVQCGLGVYNSCKPKKRGGHCLGQIREYKNLTIPALASITHKYPLTFIGNARGYDDVYKVVSDYLNKIGFVPGKKKAVTGHKGSRRSNSH